MKQMHRKGFKSLFAVLMAMFMVISMLAACAPSSAISLDKTSLELFIGQSYKLSATAPEDAEIVWESDNTKVASVRRGTVTAVSAGTANITATIDGTDVSATCAVTVKNKTVTISQSTAQIDLDTDNWTVTLTATCAEDPDTPIVWTSSDNALATVSNGVVTATGNDIGVVTITAQSGAATADCVVTIVQPSRPDDWRHLETRQNGDTIANPGEWFYFSENGITFTKSPWYGGNAVGVTFNAGPVPSSTTAKQFYFRYQPKFLNEDGENELGTLYAFTATVTVSVDAEVRVIQPTWNDDGTTKNYGTGRTYVLTANEPKQITYFGTLSDAEPMSIRINDSKDSLDGASFTVENIAFRTRTADEKEPVDPPVEQKPGDEYELTWGDKSTTVNHPGKWYYMIDSTNNGQGELIETPTYKSGVVTMKLSNTAAKSNNDNSKDATYQLRYQPWLDGAEYGTLYTVTFTVNISAAANLLVGIDAKNTTVKDIPVDTDYEITYNGSLVNNDPFYIHLKPEDPSAPITLIVKNVKFEEREETGDSYELTWGSKGDTTSDPGHWYYMINSGNDGHGTEELAETPTYENGVLTMKLNSFTEGNVYQLRVQPTLPIGTKYTVTFKVNISSVVALLIGRDSSENNRTTMLEDIPVNEDYDVTFDCDVAAGEPFYISITKFDPEKPFTLVVKNVEFKAKEGEEGPGTEVPEVPEGSTLLTEGNNATTMGNAGKWFYFADNSSAVTYTNKPWQKDDMLGVTFGTAPDIATQKYFYFRYQPTYGEGAEYTVKFKVTVSIDAEVRFGQPIKNADGSNNYNTFKTASVTANTPVELSYDGTISTVEAFSVRVNKLGEGVSSLNGVTFKVSDITVEKKAGEEPAPKTAYDLEKKNNSETIATPGVWAYNETSGGGDVLETARYEDGVITLAYTSMASATAGAQLRYQPTYAVGTKYTVSYKVTFSAAGKVGYRINASNSYNFPEVGAGETVTISYEDTVLDSQPLMIEMRASDLTAPITMTVTEFKITAKQEDTDESYDLTWGGASDVTKNPGHWYYMINTAGNGKDDINTARYENGVVTLDLKNMSRKTSEGGDGAFQLRYQPNFDAGTKYKVTFTVKLSAAGWIMAGKNGATKSFKEIPVDQEYEITLEDTVDASNPFVIQLKADDVESPIVLTVSNVVFTPVA